MRPCLVILMSLVSACGREPPTSARDAAAKVLDCPRWEVAFPAFDDDGATAQCRGQGVFLEHAGDQWIAMQSFPLTE